MGVSVVAELGRLVQPGVQVEADLQAAEGVGEGGDGERGGGGGGFESVDRLVPASCCRGTSDPLLSPQEAILRYNPAYRGRWSFDALSTFVQVGLCSDPPAPRMFQTFCW